MVPMRPWQLAVVVVACGAAALVAVRATALAGRRRPRRGRWW